MSFWEQLKKQFSKPGRPDSIKAEGAQPLGLTPREMDVFRLLLDGYTLQETANQLGVKYSTVNTHMTAIYKKLGVTSRAELEKSRMVQNLNTQNMFFKQPGLWRPDETSQAAGHLD